MKGTKRTIADYMSFGADNAVTAKQLAMLTGLPERTVTLQIESARRSGQPIIATCSGKSPGYYLTDDPKVLSAYCKQLQHREKEISKTRKAMQHINLTGQ